MTRLTLPLPKQGITTQVLADLAGRHGYNVQNPRWGAAGDGVKDDAGPIQSCINAAAASGNGPEVFFPPGIYSTSVPIDASVPGLRLVGAGPGATGGGGGTGSGSFTPGTPGTISNFLFTGAVIAPNYNGNGFSAAGFNKSATIIVDSDSFGGAVNRVTVENLTLYGAGLGATSSHALCFRGQLDACKVRNCVIAVYYGTTSDGIHLDTNNAASKSPDGQWIQDCMIQFVGNDGIHGPFGDGQITRCHTQSIGGYGFWISDTGIAGGSGGNIRVSDCRADLGINDGFFFNVGCGAFMGMITVTNCSTQRNKQNGFHVDNTASNESCPVYFTNCVAQGDGTDAASAGWRLSGPVWVSMLNCASHVNHNVDNPGLLANFPVDGIRTTQNGTGQSARFVAVHGGSYVGRTNAFNTTNAPVVQDVSTFTGLVAAGVQFGTGIAYTHVTTL